MFEDEKSGAAEEHGATPEESFLGNDDSSLVSTKVFSSYPLTVEKCHQGRNIGVYLCAVLVLVLVFAGALSVERGQKGQGEEHNRPIRLSFQKEKQDDPSWTRRTFRILQIADIHLGEAEFTEWGPKQDRKTWLALDRILAAETTMDHHQGIDMILLTGDQLTANDVNANATLYYQQLAQKLTMYGIPFGMIFGNHDDAPLEYPGPNGTIHKRPAKTSRRQLVDELALFELSLTQAGPPDVFGVSNYWLDVWFNDTTTTLVGARILLLDTGGGSLPQQIHTTQLDWFATTNRHHPSIPVVAFCHIPTTDFDAVTKNTSFCRGEQNEGVMNMTYNAGLIATLEAAGNVHFLGVGHMHGNDYCCPSTAATESNGHSSTLHLCFGRHSGYGGYGRWERGARVYELTLTEDLQFSWTSYVRMESGAIQDVYDPTRVSNL